MIVSIIEMLELPNFGHMTTSTKRISVFVFLDIIKVADLR